MENNRAAYSYCLDTETLITKHLQEFHTYQNVLWETTVIVKWTCPVLNFDQSIVIFGDVRMKI